MDSSFTEHVLERARERQKKLAPLRDANYRLNNINKQNSGSISQPNIAEQTTTTTTTPMLRKEVHSDPSLSSSATSYSPKQSKTIITSNHITGSPDVKTLSIRKESGFNMEIKFSSVDNVRLEVEIDSDDDENDNAGDKNNEETGGGKEVGSCTPALRESAKNRLQRLGKLYSGDEDLSSPIHRTEGQFRIEDDKMMKDDAKEHKPRKGLGKLAELAHDINQWEDNLTHSKPASAKENKSPTRKWKPPAKPPAPQPPKPQAMMLSPSSKHRTKAQAPKPPIQNTKPSSPSPSPVKSTDVSSKKLKWDQSVLDSLESQGFTRTESHSRLVYSYKHSQEKKEAEAAEVKVKPFVPLSTPIEENEMTPRTSPTKTATATTTTSSSNHHVVPRSPAKGSMVLERAAMFQKINETTPVAVKEKDPALLSVSERKALFEKNPSEALMPKAAFGMSVPIKNNTTTSSSSSKATTPTETSSLHDNNVATVVEPKGNIASKIAQLRDKNKTISEAQIESKVKQERKQELEQLLNRFNHHKKFGNAHEEENDSDSEHEEATETTAMISPKRAKIVATKTKSTPPPPPPPLPQQSTSHITKTKDSPQVQAAVEQVKRIKVAQPKANNLYPNLSDIEASTETERTATPSPNNSSLEDSFCDSEGGANTSFGREILKAVCHNNAAAATSQKRVSDVSTDSALSDILDDMVQYANDADADSDCTTGPTPPKQGKLSSPRKYHHHGAMPSQSFSYKEFSPPKKQQQHSPNKFKSPVSIITSPKRRDTGDLPTHVVDGSDVLPLTHTVSFYRKQQVQTTPTTVRQIIRRPEIDEDIIAEHTNDADVQDKIQHLQDEINRQNLVISQASSALNLCNSRPEFIGSTEQVEAEKLLLLASHRRQAAMLEVQRLKVEGTLHPTGHSQNIPIEKGNLKISNIVLPLKKGYVRALAAAGGKGHHVVCLVKCGEQVVATQLVSTVASSTKSPDLELRIPGDVRLENIYSDFTVTFEVYCLQAQEEILPHEVKYHINKKGSSKITPKKLKAESKMVRPPKESPAGPQAVRSSSFALNGYVIFSIQALNKKHWSLNKTPPQSPLEGSITMRLTCELDMSVEQRGFLNMFEDVSGFGAWHRRWCLLKGHTISYWKYPDEEKKKAPIDTISLKNCITKTIGPVSREICARLHTFLLELEREARPHDKDTLTVVCHNDKTIIKHLLSADTKEERLKWCENLNKALVALRMCGNSTAV